MNAQQFNETRRQLNELCESLLNLKGQDYTGGSGDRLTNFKRTAEMLGRDPLEVWAVYFHKHIDAIMAFVKTKQVASEPIVSRFVDARNYLDLGWALVEEARLLDQKTEAPNAE